MTVRCPKRAGLAVLGVALVLLSPLGLEAQESEATHWRVGGTLARAFGGEGGGGTLGVTHGLFAGASLLGGLGVDLGWSRPRLSGPRTSGVPDRRDLMTADVHLRTRIVPGALSFEIGVPLGFVRSEVGETSVVEAVAPGPPRHNRSGVRYGATLGVLGAARARAGTRVSFVAESRISSAWIFGQQHWLITHAIGIQARLR